MKLGFLVRLLLEIIGPLIAWLQIRREDKREDQEDADHRQIDDDLDAYLRDRGMLNDAADRSADRLAKPPKSDI